MVRKRVQELNPQELNPQELTKGDRKRTPNHPRGAYPLNHTADTPTGHCKHLPLAPKYH